jgi:hypothetical protein
LPSIGTVLVESAGAMLGLAASIAAALVGLAALAHAELIPGKPPR